MHFDSIEDSIAEETAEDFDKTAKIPNMYPTTPMDVKNDSSAYYSDENSSNKRIARLESLKANVDASIFESSVSSKSKWGQNIFEKSPNNHPTILVADNQPLSTIKECKPRKSRAIGSMSKKKDRQPLRSNYKKRVNDIEKQKKTIQQIEDRYREYTCKINPFKTIDKGN